MTKKNKKKSLKHFNPIDMGGVLKGDMELSDVGENFGFFSRGSREKLFLSKYSEKDLLGVMEQVGLVKHLKGRGFDTLVVEVGIDESDVHQLRVYADKKSYDSVLIDLKLSESRFVPDPKFLEEKSGIVTLDMVVIEWLSISNPRADFSGTKPQLPGQERPGLGGLGYFMKMMYHVAEGVTKDGFMDVPDHMHGAVMYSKNFKFFNPSHEAVLRAIMRDLGKHSLSDISWGMITGTVIDKSTRTPQVYDPSEQIFPVSSRINNYFKSKKYTRKFDEVYRKKSYYLDMEAMLTRRAEILKKKDPADL
ncbi:MAG: hypothetical protein EPN93_14885 [Spirochaetes bacterium]|nr:MAG: hypothetical protein EPN93_14885 [Spirochaetota bacterium]